MSKREQQLADMILRMIQHGEGCNWFADRGDNELVMEARALANNLPIRRCVTEDCSWRGPATECRPVNLPPYRFLCPECDEPTVEE